MPKWVHFTDNFDFVTSKAKNGTPRGMIAYKKGMIQPVTNACFDAVIAADKGQETTQPEGLTVDKAGKVQVVEPKTEEAPEPSLAARAAAASTAKPAADPAAQPAK